MNGKKILLITTLVATLILISLVALFAKFILDIDFGELEALSSPTHSRLNSRRKSRSRISRTTSRSRSKSRWIKPRTANRSKRKKRMRRRKRMRKKSILNRPLL